MFKCLNSECNIEKTLTKKKTGNSFDVNRCSTLASRIAGKEHRGLLKICSVLFLYSILGRKHETAAEMAKVLIRKEY